jgi:predicted DNA-binding ribbon-helix-helix protein
MTTDAAQPDDANLSRRQVEQRSTLVNRNITVAGRRTSIRLEPAMWEALRQICERERKSLNEVVTEIEGQRVESSLTAAIRVYVLSYFRAAATDEGHRLAGHGGGSPFPG